MNQQLKDRGHRADEVIPTSTSNSQLATTLHLLIRQHRLLLPADDLLLDELARVELRETAPGLLRLDHRQGDHDDHAFAVGMAAVGLWLPYTEVGFGCCHRRVVVVDSLYEIHGYQPVVKPRADGIESVRPFESNRRVETQPHTGR